MSKIERRDFLKAAALAAGGTIFGGCSQPVVRPNGESVDDLLRSGARVMWIAAHPDDESLVGSILAKSSLYYRNPLYFLILTKGEGGECCRPEGCEPNLAEVRTAEMKQVAELYHAELQHESLFNAPLPVESFPARHVIAEIWRDQKDPTDIVAEAVRSFRPDIVFTFAPLNGFTGHPEHQLTSRFAGAGIRAAADNNRKTGDLPPHRVSHFYYGLNKYWLFQLAGATDPLEVTETWDADAPCFGSASCRDVMASFSRPHRSQNNDMSTVREFKFMIKHVYLNKSDPFEIIYDPYEPA